MSTRILWDQQERIACLYDSATGQAFAEIFEGEEAYEDAERFLSFLPLDARRYAPADLRVQRRLWRDAWDAARASEGLIPIQRESAAGRVVRSLSEGGTT